MRRRFRGVRNYLQGVLGVSGSLFGGVWGYSGEPLGVVLGDIFLWYIGRFQEVAIKEK